MLNKMGNTILQEWQSLDSEGQSKLFPKEAHRLAADTFARHADQHRTQTGDFIFSVATGSSAILFSSAAIGRMIMSLQGAQALAKVVTEDVGSRSHKGAIQSLIQIGYLAADSKPKSK